MKYILLAFALCFSTAWYAHYHMEHTYIVSMPLIECYQGVAGSRHDVYQTTQCDFNNNGVVHTELYQRQAWRVMSTYPEGKSFDIPMVNEKYSTIFGLASFGWVASLFCLIFVPFWRDTE